MAGCLAVKSQSYCAGFCWLIVRHVVRDSVWVNEIIYMIFIYMLLLRLESTALGCAPSQMVSPSYPNVYIYIYVYTVYEALRWENMPKSWRKPGQQKIIKHFLADFHGWREITKTFRSWRFTWCHAQTPFSGETAFRESSHYSALTRETTDSDAWWSNWWLQNEVVSKWGRLVLNAVNLIQFRGFKLPIYWGNFMSHEVRILIDQAVQWNVIRLLERFSNEFVKRNTRLLGLKETIQGAGSSPPGVWKGSGIST